MTCHVTMTFARAARCSRDTYPRFEHDGDACWYVSHWGSARSLRPLVTLLHNLAVAGALCASYGYGYAYA